MNIRTRLERLEGSGRAPSFTVAYRAPGMTSGEAVAALPAGRSALPDLVIVTSIEHAPGARL